MFESLTLSDLPKRSCETLREPSKTRPAIWLVEEKGVRAVVKDFSRGKGFYREIIGRFLVWRESKAFRRLRGLEGVPTLYRVIDGQALVMEAIPGRRLKKHERQMRLSEAFFEALKGTVDGFHGRGLAHCDLKNASNIMVGRDGRPYLVDWAASIFQEECRCFPLNRIFRRFLLDDDLAIIKLKLHHLPETVSPEERWRCSHQSKAEKTVRGIRDRIRNTFQRMV